MPASVIHHHRQEAIVTTRYARWFGALGAPSALQIATYAIEGLPD